VTMGNANRHCGSFAAKGLAAPLPRLLIIAQTSLNPWISAPHALLYGNRLAHVGAHFGLAVIFVAGPMQRFGVEVRPHHRISATSFFCLPQWDEAAKVPVSLDVWQDDPASSLRTDAVKPGKKPAHSCSPTLMLFGSLQPSSFRRHVPAPP
jgi:hypothetical protein